MEERYLSFIRELPNNWDNPDWLSRSAIQLATILYNHNTEMSIKELEENQAKIALLDHSINDSKKISMVEAEARALVSTNNEYRKYKVQAEAIIETINSVKKRLDLLSWEHKSMR